MSSPDPTRGLDAPLAVTRATERLLEAVEHLGPAGLPAALLREVRAHGLADRATLWRRGHDGAWQPLRSFGAPTPDPGAATSPGWAAAGARVLGAAPLGELVVLPVPDRSCDEREAAEELLEALAALVGILVADLDEADLVAPPLPGGPRDGAADRNADPHRP